MSNFINREERPLTILKPEVSKIFSKYFEDNEIEAFTVRDTHIEMFVSTYTLYEDGSEYTDTECFFHFNMPIHFEFIEDSVNDLLDLMDIDFEGISGSCEIKCSFKIDDTENWHRARHDVEIKNISSDSQLDSFIYECLNTPMERFSKGHIFKNGAKVTLSKLVI